VRAQRLATHVAAALALLALYACDRLPGRPSLAARPLNPDQVTDFATLYSKNCAGCHGTNGSFGAALPLNNPAYLAIVDDGSIIDAISKGIAGTSMPAFGVSSGGMLTDAQIKSIVSGVRAHWGSGQSAVGGAPSYASAGTGDQAQGAKVYADYCASCHSASGTDVGKSGAIADPAFLALYSDQSLRTLIIAGRPDLGHPGWRDYAGKAPLDSTQVNDLVAWLSAKRGS
jgi:cytochrome c oxidase cbb3-type subunit III